MKSSFVTVALIIALVSVSRVSGICNISDADLNECKPAVSGSNPQSPSARCCQALRGADLNCLCSYKNSPVLFFNGINYDLAMALPAKCGLTAPPGC